MKNNLKKILNKISFKNKEKKIKKDSVYIDTNSYWRLLLLLAFLIILTAFGFGYFFFNQVSADVYEDIGLQTGLVETINKNELEEVIEYFNNKEQNINQVISLEKVEDPSLFVNFVIPDFVQIENNRSSFVE